MVTSRVNCLWHRLLHSLVFGFLPRLTPDFIKTLVHNDGDREDDDDVDEDEEDNNDSFDDTQGGLKVDTVFCQQRNYLHDLFRS